MKFATCLILFSFLSIQDFPFSFFFFSSLPIHFFSCFLCQFHINYYFVTYIWLFFQHVFSCAEIIRERNLYKLKAFFSNPFSYFCLFACKLIYHWSDEINKFKLNHLQQFLHPTSWCIVCPCEQCKLYSFYQILIHMEQFIKIDSLKDDI